MGVNTTVNIKVTPIIREFVIAYYNAEVIRAGKNTLLAKKIKYLLELPPEGYVPQKTECFIEVELIDYFIKMSRRKHIHTFYKNYLSETSQRMISDEFETLFKGIFRNFVAGYVIAHDCKTGSQKDAIYKFSQIYNLTFDSINFEMLKKDWDRCDEKKLIYTHSKFKHKSVA